MCKISTKWYFRELSFLQTKDMKDSNKLNGFFELWCSFNIFGLFYANYEVQYFEGKGVWILGWPKVFFVPVHFVNYKSTRMILLRAQLIFVGVPGPIRPTLPGYANEFYDIQIETVFNIPKAFIKIQTLAVYLPFTFISRLMHNKSFSENHLKKYLFFHKSTAITKAFIIAKS